MRFAALANHFGDAFRHSIVAMDGRTSARDLLHSEVLVQFPTIDTRGGNMAARLARFAGFLRETRPRRLITSNWGSIDWAIARAFCRHGACAYGGWIWAGGAVDAIAASRSDTARRLAQE